MDKIREILRRRINFLNKSIYEDDFFKLIREFKSFVCDCEEIAPIITKLMKEGRISEDLIADLVVTHFEEYTFRLPKGNKPDMSKVIPKFYTQRLEEKYGIFEMLKNSIENHNYKVLEDEKLEFNDKAMFPSSERRRYFFPFEKLYFDIIEEIELQQVRDKPIQSVGKISFNTDISVLMINDKSIKIQKYSDQYHVLKIIFTDCSRTKEEWFFSEISDMYDPAANFDDKKFYNAIYQLRQKIALETGIKDFFTTTKQSVQINTAYLS